MGGQPDREVRAERSRRHRHRVRRPFWATPTARCARPLSTCSRPLSGLGVDNAIIEIDGPEVPIMDGSSAPFVAAIDRAGIVTLRRAAPLHPKVLKPIRVDAGRRLTANCARMRTASASKLDIDFDHPLIGRQALRLRCRARDASAASCRGARTFGFMRDVAKLWTAGYALGASFENTLVVTENRVLNPEGLRLCRRVRPPQGARRDRRSGAGRCAAARRLSLGPRRPQAQPRGAVGADGRLRPPGRWSTRRSRRPVREAPRRAIRGHADLATGVVGPGLRPGRVVNCKRRC